MNSKGGVNLSMIERYLFRLQREGIIESIDTTHSLATSNRKWQETVFKYKSGVTAVINVPFDSKASKTRALYTSMGIDIQWEACSVGVEVNPGRGEAFVFNKTYDVIKYLETVKDIKVEYKPVVKPPTHEEVRELANLLNPKTP